MASSVYFLIILGFSFAFLKSVASDNSNEWDVERSSVNPLSYTDEGRHYQDRTTENPVLRSQIRRRCLANQHYSLCDANCQKTCSNYNKPIPCPSFCVWGCVCNSGFVRAPNRTCIKPADCPPEQHAEAQRNSLIDVKDTQTEEPDHSPNSEKENPPASKPNNWPPLPFPIPLICGKNEVFVPIPTSCPDDCNNFRNKDRKCTILPIPSCFCKEGFVRNHEGKCIKPSECPQEKNFCPRGEEFSSCYSHCEETCGKTENKDTCKEHPLCAPGCTCKEGLVRGPEGTCIYSTECPTEPPTEPPKKVCPDNEVNEECKAVCQPNCSNIDIGIPCPRICIPGCVCKDPLIRGKYGKCVAEDECPKDDFPQEDDDPKSVTTIPSVSETEEPSRKCPPHHRFIPCHGHCERNCTNKDDKNFRCRPVCVPGCVCKEGLVKGPDGNCIEEEKCPKSDSEEDSYVTLNPPPYTDDDYHIPESKTKIPPSSETENSQFEEIPPRQHSNQFPFPLITCGKNEVRDLNPSNCPDDCKNYQDTNRKCGKSLIPACVCKKGFVRGPKKDCIKPTDCPQESCGKGEIWSKCHGNCEKDCNNWAQDIICPKACVSGCKCRPGLVRGRDKKCGYWFNCPKKPSSYSELE